MTFDLAETFYFKPEAGRLMVSPVDMAPSEPCDAQADELEIAMAIDRIHSSTTMSVRTIKHRWGGLRTFAPDHEPVIGPDPEEPSFVWLAGRAATVSWAPPRRRDLRQASRSAAAYPWILQRCG